MKILPIQISCAKNTKTGKNVPTLNQNENARPVFIMPTVAHYVSFLGGYSLNLKDSIKNLDDLDAQFPPHIKSRP